MNYETLETELLDWIARAPGRVSDENPDALSGDFSDEAFTVMAQRVYDFQREHNRPFRQFCDYQNAPERLETWRELPAVPTGAFRHAALRAFPEAETCATFRTSGTTGEGFGSHHFRSLKLYEASILQGWRALRLPALPQIILTQRPGAAPHSSLCYMMGTLGEGSSQSAPIQQTWAIDATGALDLAAVRAAAEFGPVAILGTALAFLHLFETLEKSSEISCQKLTSSSPSNLATLPLAAGSFAMETGGYKGTGRTLAKADLYRQFEHQLALPPDAVFNEYSMTELSSQWWTHGLGRPHFGPAWARALVIDPETNREVGDGERGLLRLIDLANLGSVAAIQTQDLAIRRGPGFELLGRDPNAIPRGCSRSADELLSGTAGR